jgi:hypothetical protein
MAVIIQLSDDAKPRHRAEAHALGAISRAARARAHDAAGDASMAQDCRLQARCSLDEARAAAREAFGPANVPHDASAELIIDLCAGAVAGII